MGKEGKEFPWEFPLRASQYIFLHGTTICDSLIDVHTVKNLVTLQNFAVWQGTIRLLVFFIEEHQDEYSASFVAHYTALLDIFSLAAKVAFILSCILIR